MPQRPFVDDQSYRLAEYFLEHEPHTDAWMNPPWLFFTRQGWRIVGMNHYQQGGELRLFVAMTKGSICIQEEGPDDEYLWSRLAHKVWNLNAKEFAQEKRKWMRE